MSTNRSLIVITSMNDMKFVSMRLYFRNGHGDPSAIKKAVWRIGIRTLLPVSSSEL